MTLYYQHGVGGGDGLKVVANSIGNDGSGVLKVATKLCDSERSVVKMVVEVAMVLFNK